MVMENNENSLEFNEAENKVRKRWLFWSIKLPAFLLGCFIIFIGRFTLLLFFDLKIAITVFLFFLLLPLSLYMNYYCSYENPGTNLLLLSMIGITLNLIANFFKAENLALIKAPTRFSFFMLMMLFLQLIVLYYSYKMRKINKKMQEKRLRASPIYINALSFFSTATNLEELNKHFSRLKNSDDSGTTVQILLKAYDQEKERLRRATNISVNF
jgi:hypothetical protein